MNRRRQIKGRVYAKARMKNLARVGDFDSLVENGTGRGQRDGQCQTAETRDGHLRSGKPLKDSKQKSDRTSFTKSVIRPPLFLFSLLLGSPHCWGELGNHGDHLQY